MSRDVRIFDFAGDQERLTAQFDADADVLAAARGRIALFVAGAPVRLTLSEIERLLSELDTPDTRHAAATQLIYWRLSAATRSYAVWATIEHRLAVDFEETLAVSASNGTVTLDNEPSEQE